MKPGRLKRQQQVLAHDHVDISFTRENQVAAPLAAVKLAKSSDFPRLLMALALRPQLASATDAFGMTALHWICSEPTVSPRVVLTVARTHTAAAATRNLAGLLPLHLAVKKGLVLEAIQALLHVYPKAVEMRTPDGKTSLMLAKQKPVAASGVLTLLEVLEAHGRTRAMSSVVLPMSQWPAMKPKTGNQQLSQLQQQQYQRKEREDMRLSEGYSLSRCSTQKEETLGAMMTPHIPPPRWALALKCRLCAAKFGYFRKRHHCRSCGASVCGRHSRHRVPLKQLGLFQPQRVCECCFEELHRQLNVRASERVTRTGGAYPYIDNGELNSTYSTNSMSIRARYRRRSKSVFSEPAQRQRPSAWRYDDDNDSEASTNGFIPVSAPWSMSSTSLKAVESLQPEMGSMSVSVDPLQATVLEHRRLLQEQPGYSIESETTRRRSRQQRPRPHSSSLDKSLHVQRLSEVENGYSSDDQEMEQRMQQLAAARRDLGAVMWRDEEKTSRTEREKFELDVVANKCWGIGYSNSPEDEDEDEEAEIAATLAFMNGGRRMSCTADLLGQLEPPLDGAAAHYELGEVLLRKGDFTGAVVELRRSVQLGGNNAVAWLCLAKALDSSGSESKSAEEAARRALGLEPASIGALSLLGKLLHLRGDHDNAILVFRQALKLQCPTGNLPGHAAKNDAVPLSITM